mgnify:CR=1 FL=1
MGLDIFLYELVKPSKKEYKNFEEIDLIDNPDEELDYHDITDYSEEVLTGLNPEYICEVCEENYDWDCIFKENGLNKDDYQWIGSEFPEEGGIRIYTFAKDTADFDNLKETDCFKYIVTENTPMKTEKRKIILHRAGYDVSMRKGANKQFYDDGMWSDTNLVFSKAILEKHRDLYFSHDTTYYSSDEETRKNFQKFIDNFVDGKMFVGYF